MRTVHPFAEHQPFDRATCDTMGLAFDTAWQALLVSGSQLVASGHADRTREELALRIVEMAKRGERDLNRLRDDAVEYVLNTDRRKQA